MGDHVSNFLKINKKAKRKDNYKWESEFDLVFLVKCCIATKLQEIYKVIELLFMLEEKDPELNGPRVLSAEAKSGQVSTNGYLLVHCYLLYSGIQVLSKHI